jgi:hypothetical protein
MDFIQQRRVKCAIRANKYPKRKYFVMLENATKPCAIIALALG